MFLPLRAATPQGLSRDYQGAAGNAQFDSVGRKMNDLDTSFDILHLFT